MVKERYSRSQNEEEEADERAAKGGEVGHRVAVCDEIAAPSCNVFRPRMYRDKFCIIGGIKSVPAGFVLNIQSDPASASKEL